jgi:putative CocE/NonD family hydrolase
MSIRRVWVVVCAVFVTSSVFAQARPDVPDYDVKEHYTKYEYRIPMRDGVHLFTSVYVPKDSSHAYPFLINRTPYSVGPYGVDLYRTQLGPAPEFDKSGYIFVFQDVRGRFMSEGSFIEMRPHIDNKKSKQDVDDSSDLYDTIDWLLKNVPNNNGNAGIWGISYPGFFTSASIIDSHPALKAASPQAPMTDLFMGDDAYHGGKSAASTKEPGVLRMGNKGRVSVLFERGAALEFAEVSRRQECALGRPGKP